MVKAFMNLYDPAAIWLKPSAQPQRNKMLTGKNA